jgi:hypothetical protein
VTSPKGPEKLSLAVVFSGKLKTLFLPQGKSAASVHVQLTLNKKSFPCGNLTTARPPFGQKIVPIFSFFWFGPAGKTFPCGSFSGKFKIKYLKIWDLRMFLISLKKTTARESFSGRRPCGSELKVFFKSNIKPLAQAPKGAQGTCRA